MCDSMYIYAAQFINLPVIYTIGPVDNLPIHRGLGGDVHGAASTWPSAAQEECQKAGHFEVTLPLIELGKFCFHFLVGNQFELFFAPKSFGTEIIHLADSQTL